MSYDGQQYYYQPRPMFRFPKLTPAVKALLIANVACFVLQIIFQLFTKPVVRPGRLPEPFFEHLFAFHPDIFLRGQYIWQIVTSLFLHGGIWHLAINMFMLSMAGFGPGLERHIGTRRFYCVYFLCGIGGNLLFLAANINGTIPVLGASGAVVGVLAAYAMAFPERLVLLFFFIPIKVKWLALGFFVLEVLMEISRGGSAGIAHGAHVGGFIFGWAYMKIVYKLSLPFAWIERLKWKVRRWFSNVPRPNIRLRRRGSARKYRPVDDDSFIDEEIDPILEKIARHGIHSLTSRERRALKRARQRMERG